MEQAVVITGAGIPLYQMLLVRQGLKACKIGMRLNTAYTPTNLRKMAEKITGKRFSRGTYDAQIRAMDAAIEKARAALEPGDIQ